MVCRRSSGSPDLASAGYLCCLLSFLVGASFLPGMARSGDIGLWNGCIHRRRPSCSANAKSFQSLLCLILPAVDDHHPCCCQEPEIYKEVKQKLDDGSVKFEVLCDKDRTPKKAQVMGYLERRILEVNRKRVKVVRPGSKTSFPTTEVRGTYTPPFHVELYRNDQHRFKIVVDGENEVDLMVQTRHMRYVIILVIRGLAQKFNSTSLNSLLEIEA